MNTNIQDVPSELMGRVLNIQRMSTEDGPGIRTTVFFKGCSLRCNWCHNPESILLKPQVQWIETKCIGCKICVETCPRRALSITKEGILIDRNICVGCGKCSKECPSTAMEILGRMWGLEALVDEVAKDRSYYGNAGGVSVSGGEPTMQAPFVASFLRECKKRELHTALDTCGSCSRASLEMLLPFTDLVLYDLKEIDPLKHEKFTGSPNQLIFENIKFIRDYMMTQSRTEGRLWVRTSLIPDATATEDNIRGIGRFMARELGEVVSRWELCSFNNLCRDKYRRLGLEWQYNDTKPLTKEFLERMVAVAMETGVNPGIILGTGLTRLETY